MQNATYVNIMQLARQKYLNLKLDEQHQWGAPSEEESKTEVAPVESTEPSVPSRR